MHQTKGEMHMFNTYAEYVKAATSVLQDKPKGTGYQNATGVVLLVGDMVCYVEAGEGLSNCCESDASAFDEPTIKHEWDCLQSPVFVERFAPAEVEAYEVELGC